MNKEELVANLGTIARSGSKVRLTQLFQSLLLLILTVVLISRSCCSSSCRLFWMLFRVKPKPAAPSLVSSVWVFTPPSWWLIRWTFILRQQNQTLLDTSGPQTGETHQKRDGFNNTKRMSFYYGCSIMTKTIISVVITII